MMNAKRARCFWCVLSLLLSGCAETVSPRSGEITGYYLPELSLDYSVQTSPAPSVWSGNAFAEFQEIRVKIFPHNGKYSIPQGAETVVDRLNITSAAPCDLYEAVADSSEIPFSRDHLLQEASSFSFSAAEFKTSYWLECSAPALLERIDFPGKAIPYTGRLFLKKVVNPDGAPYITVVNVLPFEEYLKGVVPAEMPASWPSEALKVQAVAARTYSLFKLVNQAGEKDPKIAFERSGAQLDDTVAYQAYLGRQRNSAATDAAVDGTAGEVMLFDDRVILAFFHADSGGHTEDALNLFGLNLGYILGRKEIYPEGGVPGSDWIVKMELATLDRTLREKGFISAESSIQDIFIDAQDQLPSGRPSWITLRLTDGSRKKVSSGDFAFAFRLKSRWIRIVREAEQGLSTISFVGKGFGHGGGMSQWGARLMSELLGKDYREILRFYYSGITLAR